MAKSKKEPQKSYIVIKDTRETEGYTFSKNEKYRCMGMVNTKLDTGDYTLRGLEDRLCIERKASVEEMAINLGKERGRFMREIERMKPFEHKIILMEFTLQQMLDFPNHAGSRVPHIKRNDVRMTGAFMLKSMLEIQIEHGVHLLFCGSRMAAMKTISSIFKRMADLYLFNEE